MTKGPPIPAPRPKRAVIELEDLPWTSGGSGETLDQPRCAATRTFDVELSEALTAQARVVAVPIDGSVRIISKGIVLATLLGSAGADLVVCMREGWRYTGQLTPIASMIGTLTLEGRHLE